MNMNTVQIIHWLIIFDCVAFGVLVILANTISAFVWKSIADLPKWVKIVILIPPTMFIPILLGCLIAAWQTVAGWLSKFWKWYYHEEDDEDFDAIF